MDSNQRPVKISPANPFFEPALLSENGRGILHLNGHESIKQSLRSPRVGARARESIPCTAIRYQGEVGGTRVCTHFYNTKEDVDEFIDFQKT